jgi:plasmid stabilization system protein ParE
MKLVYLQTAFPDVVWMRRYYRSVFPQGARKAREQLFAVERLIMENPDIGRRINGGREFPIARTPFVFIYRRNADTIEVARIWDARRDPEDLEF